MLHGSKYLTCWHHGWMAWYLSESEISKSCTVISSPLKLKKLLALPQRGEGRHFFWVLSRHWPVQITTPLVLALNCWFSTSWSSRAEKKGWYHLKCWKGSRNPPWMWRSLAGLNSPCSLFCSAKGSPRLMTGYFTTVHSKLWQQWNS